MITRRTLLARAAAAAMAPALPAAAVPLLHRGGITQASQAFRVGAAPLPFDVSIVQLPTDDAARIEAMKWSCDYAEGRDRTVVSVISSSGIGVPVHIGFASGHWPLRRAL